ncbi:MAG: sugar O-acetyltransferase [Alphaproteobacteria bacterium]|nr:sugar O-acetyltransferase [Alphaproteobacteria bacterium]
MTEKEKMLSGQLYRAEDGELSALRFEARNLCHVFNRTNENQKSYRQKIIRELLGRVGTNVNIHPSFRCDYGFPITIGNNFYANYDCIILDVCPVTIGDNVMFGPRVCIYTAGHPLDAEVRAAGVEYGKPVTIGDNVWIGGNTVVNPGVKIGNNVVIGSGSVVTKDIPDNVIAAGNPCRILRALTEEDKQYWLAQKAEYERTNHD